MPGTTNFPAALDSHTGADPFGLGEQFNNEFATTTTDHSDSIATVTVDSTTNFPTRGIAVWEDEVITYTGKTATTLTGATRGAGGTAAAAHASGSRVEQVPAAAHHNDIAAAIVALQTKLGIGADVAAANEVLRGTGAGATAFGQVQAADIAAGAVGLQQIAETIVAGASVADITFSSIPGSYRNLIVTLSGRGTTAAVEINLRMQVNGITTGYDFFQRYVDLPGVVFVSEGLNQASAMVGALAAADAAANLSGDNWIVLYDYARTTYEKAFRGSGQVRYGTTTGDLFYNDVVGWRRATTAITSIKLFAATGNLAIGTVATLWGMK
jgi:hypothetical protein